MKKNKLFLFLFLIPISHFLVAQNVGIGEPSPSEKLDVNGRIVAKGYKNTIYDAGGLSASSVTLDAGGTWFDMPDLYVIFELDAATTVMSSYTISTVSAGPGFLVTRIMIDGTEVTRMINGSVSGAIWFGINDQYVSELSAGLHTITVQYKTDIVGIIIDPACCDYMNRLLQVLVFGSN